MVLPILLYGAESWPLSAEKKFRKAVETPTDSKNIRARIEAIEREQAALLQFAMKHPVDKRRFNTIQIIGAALYSRLEAAEAELYTLRSPFISAGGLAEGLQPAHLGVHCVSGT